MRTKRNLLGLVLLFSIFVVLPCSFAAEATTNAVPTTGTTATQVSFPWVAILTAIIPLIISLLKAALPLVNTRWLPLVSAIIGLLAELLLNFAGFSLPVPGLGSVLGLAGVGLREVCDQLRKIGTPPKTP